MDLEAAAAAAAVVVSAIFLDSLESGDEDEEEDVTPSPFATTVVLEVDAGALLLLFVPLAVFSGICFRTRKFRWLRG